MFTAAEAQGGFEHDEKPLRNPLDTARHNTSIRFGVVCHRSMRLDQSRVSHAMFNAAQFSQAKLAQSQFDATCPDVAGSAYADVAGLSRSQVSVAFPEYADAAGLSRLQVSVAFPEYADAAGLSRSQVSVAFPGATGLRNIVAYRLFPAASSLTL